MNPAKLIITCDDGSSPCTCPSTLTHPSACLCLRVGRRSSTASARRKVRNKKLKCHEDTHWKTSPYVITVTACLSFRPRKQDSGIFFTRPLAVTVTANSWPLHTCRCIIVRVYAISALNSFQYGGCWAGLADGVHLARRNNATSTIGMPLGLQPSRMAYVGRYCDILCMHTSIRCVGCLSTSWQPGLGPSVHRGERR